MPATPRPDARTRLLDAALTVFRTRGYSATRVEDLCAAAGLTKGGFFHHFASKEDLAIAAAAHWTAVTDAAFARADYQRHEDPLARVLGYLDLRRALLQGPVPDFTCYAGTLLQETFDTSPALREACGRCITSHAAAVARDIAEARRVHAPDATWDPGELALHTQAVLQGAFILAKAHGGPAPAVASVDHLKRYIESLFTTRVAHS